MPLLRLAFITGDSASLGRLDEAEGYFEQLITQAQAHSDLQHLAAAYNNRCLLWLENTMSVPPFRR